MCLVANLFEVWLLTEGVQHDQSVLVLIRHAIVENQLEHDDFGAEDFLPSSLNFDQTSHPLNHSFNDFFLFTVLWTVRQRLEDRLHGLVEGGRGQQVLGASFKRAIDKGCEGSRTRVNPIKPLVLNVIVKDSHNLGQNSTHVLTDVLAKLSFNAKVSDEVKK